MADSIRLITFIAACSRLRNNATFCDLWAVLATTFAEGRGITPPPFIEKESHANAQLILGWEPQTSQNIREIQDTQTRSLGVELLSGAKSPLQGHLPMALLWTSVKPQTQGGNVACEGNNAGGRPRN